MARMPRALPCLLERNDVRVAQHAVAHSLALHVQVDLRPRGASGAAQRAPRSLCLSGFRREAPPDPPRAPRTVEPRGMYLMATWSPVALSRSRYAMPKAPLCRWWICKERKQRVCSAQARSQRLACRDARTRE